MKNLDQKFLISGRENSESESIPIDLLIDIFSRVPAKSTARFRCVSKFWESILGRRDFTELFLTRSSTRTRLLFTFHAHGNLFFYSSPQPQNPDENSCLVATRYHNYPLRDVSSNICPPLCGLVCLQDVIKKTATVICNPVTGESINIPNVDTETRSHLGYDPVDKQYKVLFWSHHERHNMCDEYRVVTLETGKHLWRMIKCKPHYPIFDRNRICINGFLYYLARFETSSMIVCFDVRHEKFHFIDINESMELHSSWTLINYKGKLGSLQFTNWTGIDLVLRVLEDIGEHKWSRHIYVLPPLYSKIITKTMLFIVGMTGTGEVVLAPHYYLGVISFYVFYYNLERNTLIKVDIQGFEEFKHCKVYTILDYLENVMLM